MDQQAQQALHKEIERQQRLSPELALERALQALEVRTGTAHFTNVKAEDEALGAPAEPPRQRPAGVSAAEWQAFRALAPVEDAENGSVSYTLIDVDGDGLRELVIDAYVGGTGLFNQVSVQRLFGRSRRPAAEPLYSLNGRGSNQSAHWVRLAGRVYVAWLNGQFGRDEVFLLRPLHPGAPALRLAVHYTYQLQVVGLQADEANVKLRALAPEEKASLQASLKRYEDGEIRGPNTEGKPLCPTATGAEEDVSFGPGHYSFEIVGEHAVWLNGRCHLAQLIDWFGRYGEAGLFAQLRLRQPGQDQETAYELAGRRRLVRTVAQPGAVPSP